MVMSLWPHFLAHPVYSTWLNGVNEGQQARIWHTNWPTKGNTKPTAKSDIDDCLAGSQFQLEKR